MEKKTAYFAGGCFWCITPTFKETDGVFDVCCGYSGGNEENPTYEQVKHQETGHRETICVTYDAGKVSYGELLELFLSGVDPFDGEGQFIDRGHSYTLAVYTQSEEESATAKEKIAALEQESGKKVFVAVEAFQSFYEAEEMHQNYYLKNPEAFQKELLESGRIS